MAKLPKLIDPRCHHLRCCRAFGRPECLVSLIKCRLSVPPSTLSTCIAPLPHQLHRIDDVSIRDQTVTMSSISSIIKPDSPHLCYM